MSTATTEATSRRGSVRAEPGQKRIRAYLGGELVADTSRPLLVWESPKHPTYYFPAEDVRAELEESGSEAHSPSRGDARILTVKTQTRKAPGGALRYDDSPLEEVNGLIRLDWEAMDAWFEEDEQIFYSVRDPYTRLDILRSSRHVRVEVDGVTVAESNSPTIIFETGLPARFYVPKTHVRLDLLEHTDSQTYCPYKGQAEYWSLRLGDAVHEDVFWSYPTPLPENEKVAGLVSFYSKKVDLYVDGVLQQ